MQEGTVFSAPTPSIVSKLNRDLCVGKELSKSSTIRLPEFNASGFNRFDLSRTITTSSFERWWFKMSLLIQLPALVEAAGISCGRGGRFVVVQFPLV